MTDVLASKLRNVGVCKTNPMVGIMMERCLEYVVSYIAVHKAGMTSMFLSCLKYVKFRD